MRAFRALWKRSYSKYVDLLGSVVYEDPWLAGGHNGLSNSEDPERPEDPYPRVAELRQFIDAYPARMARDAADTLAYLCTSPYDVRLAQERFPKIHFHPLREHAGLALQKAG